MVVDGVGVGETVEALLLPAPDEDCNDFGVEDGADDEDGFEYPPLESDFVSAFVSLLVSLLVVEGFVYPLELELDPLDEPLEPFDPELSEDELGDGFE